MRSATAERDISIAHPLQRHRGVMSRQKIVNGIGVFVLLVPIVFTVYVLARPRPTINQATADRIKSGMTESEREFAN